MPSVANYIVVHDTSFRLGPDQERTLEFNVPSEIASSGNSRRPIIAFFADPSSDADLRCEIDVNDQSVLSYRYQGGVGRERAEVLRHNNLNPGATNTIQFRVERGDGTIHFSDVVLWYQQNV